MTLPILAARERLVAQAQSRLDALFEAQALQTPDAVAVLHKGAQLTYGELAAWSGRIADQLAVMGVGPGILVAVCMLRTPRMLAAMLGVLKAGGAYLPLDPAYPTERLAFMLADSKAAVVLTDCGLQDRMIVPCDVLDLRGEAAGVTPAQSPPSRSPTAPEDLAYVIYTSGSTGQPKGVMLGHTATGLVRWARETFRNGELAGVAATTSICFDPSILEIFAPLCTGGTVILKENVLEPFGPGERPTMLNCVPSALMELCRAGAVPDSVRVVNVGGEPLKAALVREAYRSTCVEAVYNHYGPTEATTCTTVALAAPDAVEEPPIGRPIAGAQIHVLDPAGCPAAPGEIGEIHIGGSGLALGYLNRPELTAERFVPSRWGRLYRTGDLGRWSPQGDLEFHGRIDGQVKIRGFRVETAEVEAALMRLPQVQDAAVLARPDANGRVQLIGYVQSPAPLSWPAARAQLSAWLPRHMVPSRLVVLESFPLTLSGKVDRKALPQPEIGSTSRLLANSRIEEAICEVFKDVLARRDVGPEDSFFDLGGDSLAGVTAALRLEEILGYELPSALIHQAPTARALAEAIERCPVHQPDHLTVLQPGGERRPLFCLADLFGRPFSYLSLARHLASERPVFGLSPGPLEERFAAEGKLSDLTAAFVEAVRRAQPNGPYLVAGYSAGGVLAFDLACALERDGASVNLVLLDSSMRSQRPSPGRLARWMGKQALDLMAPRTMRARYERFCELRTKFRQSLAARPPERPPEWIPPGRAALARRMVTACATYSPGRFHGRTLLLKSSERDRIDALLDWDGMLGWRAALAGPVETQWVPGDHHGFMREPRVAATADRISSFIEMSLGEEASSAATA